MGGKKKKMTELKELSEAREKISDCIYQGLQKDAPYIPLVNITNQILNLKVAGGYSIKDLIVSANAPIKGRIMGMKKRPDLIISDD